MATATKKTVDVVKSVTVQEERVVLDMSKEEAQTLIDIYGSRVLGEINGRRKHTETVYGALVKAGFGVNRTTADMDGFVDFNR